VRTLFLTLFLFNLSTLAGDSNLFSSKNIKKFTESETFKMVKDVIIEVKEVTDKYPVQTIDADQEAQLDICVECSDILNLTKHINKIVEKIGKDDPTSYLMLENGNLQALTVITEVVDKINGSVVCNYEQTENLSHEFKDIKEDDLILQVEKNSDIQFASAQYRLNGGNKVIWLRGKARDQRKVIKVTLYPDGKSLVSYYLLPYESYNENLKTSKRTISDDLPDLNPSSPPSTSLKDFVSGEIDLSTEMRLDSSKDTYVKVVLGPTLDYQYFIPKDVKILDLKSKAQITDDYNISSNIELTAKEQKASFDLQNNRGKKLLTAEFDGKQDVKLGAAAEIDLSEEFSIDSLASYSLDGSYTIDASLKYSSEPILDSSYTRTSLGEERYTISKKIVDKSKGTFSIKLEKSTDSFNQTQKGVWLTYSKKF